MRRAPSLLLLLSLLAGPTVASAASQGVEPAPPGPYRNQEGRFQVMVAPKETACLPQGLFAGAIVFFAKPGTCQSLLNPIDTFFTKLPPALLILGELRRDDRSVLDLTTRNCVIPAEPLAPITRKAITLEGARCLQASDEGPAILYSYRRPADAKSGAILYGFLVKYDGPPADAIRRIEDGLEKFDLLD